MLSQGLGPLMGFTGGMQREAERAEQGSLSVQASTVASHHFRERDAAVPRWLCLWDPLSILALSLFRASLDHGKHIS